MLSTTIISAITRTHKKSKRNQFIPGQAIVPVSGKVFDEDELLAEVEAVLDGWWTEGRFAAEFEKEFAKLLGVRYVSLVPAAYSSPFQ